MAKKKVLKTAPQPASNNAFKDNAAEDTAEKTDPTKQKKSGLQAWLAKSKLAKSAKTAKAS